MPFTFTPLAVPDVVLVESRAFPDPRGWFREGFRDDEFAAAGLPGAFAQDNCSFSVRGVLRGLHFQRPEVMQGKYVSCAFGEIFDVAVDLRVGSPTYGRWVGERLSLDNGRALWIPEGFGHGFCVCSDAGAVVTYKCTNRFSAAHDGGVRFDDTEIGVEWPIDDPILSDKDRSLPTLAELGQVFTYPA